MPRSVARRCSDTASRPSAEPTRAAWPRMAWRVFMPRRRRRSVDSWTAIAENISTNGRLLLPYPTVRAISLFKGDDRDRIGASRATWAGQPGALGPRAGGRAVWPPVARIGLPEVLQPHLQARPVHRLGPAHRPPRPRSRRGDGQRRGRRRGAVRQAGGLAGGRPGDRGRRRMAAPGNRHQARGGPRGVGSGGRYHRVCSRHPGRQLRSAETPEARLTRRPPCLFGRRGRGPDPAMSDRDLLRVLRSTREFAGVSDRKLRRLLPYLDELCVDAGSRVAEEGRLCHQFVIVASGILETCRRGRAGKLGPGESFGWDAMRARGPNDGSVLATSPASLLVMGHAQFRAAEGLATGS